MAATAELPVQAANPGRILASDRQAHLERMETRRTEREKRLPELIRCLDADHATSVEHDKPKFNFRVKCTIQEHDPKLRRMVPVEKSGEVEAQNEDEAWSKFCDKWKVRVGPRYCNRVIERLSRKRSAQDN